MVWTFTDSQINLIIKLLNDDIAPYSTSNIIQCRIHCIFIIKQLVQKVRAFIKSISKWSTLEFEIEWTKLLWIDPKGMPFINDTTHEVLFAAWIEPIGQSGSFKPICDERWKIVLFTSFLSWNYVMTLIITVL